MAHLCDQVVIMKSKREKHLNHKRGGKPARHRAAPQPMGMGQELTPLSKCPRCRSANRKSHKACTCGSSRTYVRSSTSANVANQGGDNPSMRGFLNPAPSGEPMLWSVRVPSSLPFVIPKASTCSTSGSHNPLARHLPQSCHS